jgi:outer membrane protein assembly complex protein YaeT
MRGLFREKVFLFLACFVSTLTTFAAPAIRSVSFHGNTAFTERELLTLISSRTALKYSDTILKNDLRTVLEHYQQAGFLDVRIEQPDMVYDADSSTVAISVTIKEGRQTVLSSVVVTGQSLFTASEILSRFDMRPGDPLDKNILDRDIDALLERYERAGYPFVQCRVESLERREGTTVDSLVITLAVDEGRRVTIDEIKVEGNTETDASVVVRETRLADGEVFNPAKVEAIKPRLVRLNIFSEVQEPELYVWGRKSGLLITVKEGNTSTFDGIVGYIPSATPGEPGYVTGLTSISMRSLFGTGRKLSFRWQREDRFSQEIGLRYLEPWLLGYPVNVGGGFFQRQQDSSYVRRVVDLRAELMVSDELSVAALFGSESVIPSADTTINRVFNSSTVSTGIELQYDSRDDGYSPTSGARYRTDYQYGRKRISKVPASLEGRIPRSSTIQRLSLDLDSYFSTFPKQVLAIGLHGRELQGSQVEEGEMFRFGGMKTMRGYRENQFLGSRVAWSNAEYRFLLARRSFVYGFLDTGYYLRPADGLRSIPKSDGFRYGYGIGVQLETGLGNLGVSFALGQGDSFNQGKIHFGLVNDF